MILNVPDETVLKLPDTTDHSIVIISGNHEDHIRFGLRLQQEFGSMIRTWYQLDDKIPARYFKEEKTKPVIASRSNRPLIAKAVSYIKRRGVRASFSKALKFINRASSVENHSGKIDPSIKIFKEELNHLKKSAILSPVIIHPGDLNTNEFITKEKLSDAYFLLTLTDHLFEEKLLQSVRGIALNLHPGHAPDYKGTHVLEWAIYKRDLLHVSATIHIANGISGNGAILRRSNPCIFPSDNINLISKKVSALGTELMINTVREIIINKALKVFIPPADAGKTYTDEEFNPDISRCISRDLRKDWLADELLRIQQF